MTDMGNLQSYESQSNVVGDYIERPAPITSVNISPTHNIYKNRDDKQSYELMISEQGGTPLTRIADSALDGTNNNFADSPIPGQDPLT